MGGDTYVAKKTITDQITEKIWNLLDILELEMEIERKYGNDAGVSIKNIKISDPSIGYATLQYRGYRGWYVNVGVKQGGLENILKEKTKITIEGEHVRVTAYPQYDAKTGELVGYVINPPAPLVGQTADDFYKFVKDAEIIEGEYSAKDIAKKSPISNICGDSAIRVCFKRFLPLEQISGIVHMLARKGYNITLTFEGLEYKLFTKPFEKELLQISWVGGNKDLMTSYLRESYLPLLKRLFGDKVEADVTYDLKIELPLEKGSILRRIFNRAASWLGGKYREVKWKIEDWRDERKEIKMRKRAEAIKYAEKDARASHGEDEIEDDVACVVLIRDKCIKEYMELINE